MWRCMWALSRGSRGRSCWAGLSLALRHLSRGALIAMGAAIYAAHVVLMPVLAATAFAIGTLAPGYRLAASVGAGIMVTGALALMVLDRARLNAS